MVAKARCDNTTAHNLHEWYFNSTFRRECPGVQHDFTRDPEALALLDRCLAREEALDEVSYLHRQRHGEGWPIPGPMCGPCGIPHPCPTYTIATRLFVRSTRQSEPEVSPF